MFKGKRIISFLLVIMMLFSVVGFAAEDGISEGTSEISLEYASRMTNESKFMKK